MKEDKKKKERPLGGETSRVSDGEHVRRMKKSIGRETMSEKETTLGTRVVGMRNGLSAAKLSERMARVWKKERCKFFE